MKPNKTLVYVPFDEAVTGERYVTEMKHGWIEGVWDGDEKTCSAYYWRDMEWYPHALYTIVNINDTVVD